MVHPDSAQALAAEGGEQGVEENKVVLAVVDVQGAGASGAGETFLPFLLELDVGGCHGSIEIAARGEAVGVDTFEF